MNLLEQSAQQKLLVSSLSSLHAFAFGSACSCFSEAIVNVRPWSQGMAHEKGIRLFRGTREGTSQSEISSLKRALS